ncbi:hypothetical protein [Vibrio cholerae]|uniref:hypothetical protein n=1 Tax=Vibrio cholerae TaxID=666 RepID=UPI001A1BE9B1|nr:hypothetical protein [Vibrio cholerae]
MKKKILPFIGFLAAFGVGYFANSIVMKKEMETCLMTNPQMDNQKACLNLVLGIKQ